MTKNILVKFLNNTCTEAELEEVFQWITNESLSIESMRKVKSEWNAYGEEQLFTADEKFSMLFDKIQQKIDSRNLTDTKTKRGAFSLTLVASWLTKAAAVLLIPVLALLLYTLSEQRLESVKLAGLAVDTLEIVAPIGSRTVVHLSDGSDVHLNYGSKLKYPQFFSGDTREVQLSGEGYFHVAHDTKKPFIVSAGKFVVKAVGTSFNVSAYPDDEVVETTLVNGKVILGQTGISGKINSVGTMIPGQHVKYSLKTGEASSILGNVEKYVAWKDGKLIFDDATLTRVADKLSRMFNADIEVSEEVKDYLYTVTIVDEPLSQILELMTIATPISYHCLPREKLPDGTFSKQKIVFSKK